MRGRSVSEPDIGERKGKGLGLSLTESIEAVRRCKPFNAFDTEDDDGFENVTPFECMEVTESALAAEAPASEEPEFETVVVVTAVVVLAGLIMEGREGSARTVMFEFDEILRRVRSELPEACMMSDSEGRVERDGGMAMGGKPRDRGFRDAGVGEGS